MQSAAHSADAFNFAAARSIVRTLHEHGYEAWLAGGCVRDLLLGRIPKDYDVATSATPDVVLGMFPNTFAVGAHFGVVLVATDSSSPLLANPNQPDAAPSRVTEVATFRSDGSYSDGRHPDSVRYTQSAEEDASRRDFTINGLLLDPDWPTPDPPISDPPISDSRTFALRAAVVDFVGGLADLDAGILRAIGSPEQRFTEDHLRMLRAVRFAARFNLQIEPQTHAAIRAQASRIQLISRERVRNELTYMLTEGHARAAFEQLDELALLPQVLPEVARMKGVEQPPQFHPEGDVWTHTLLLLEQLQADCPLTLAWGALLHDVGKPATFRRAERIRFDGHVDMGVAISADICQRFRFSNDETAQILALVHNHMRFADAQHMKTSTLKRFFRLDRFPEHLALHRMDCMAASGHLDHWNFVRERYGSMPTEALRPAPLITGQDLIAAGYPPGPLFKQILHAVEEAHLDGAITTADEALSLVRREFPYADIS